MGENPLISFLYAPSPLCKHPFLPHLSLYFVLSPALSTAAEGRELQVAHGVILRCFWKRWQGLSVDTPLRMMLDPGELAILRYILSDQTGLW
jgi:hypothetical protein